MSRAVSDAPLPQAQAPLPPPAEVTSLSPYAGATGRWIAVGAVFLAALSAAAVVYAWNTQQRVKALESELVKRQQTSTDQAGQAHMMAKQAQDIARDSAAKLSLLEARVAESSMQRSQLEDLIQQLARSRDENVLADVDAALRVALQQSAITGSAEPLLATLRQSDERLARFNQPRLERVRRAVAQDLDRVRAAGVGDITVLTIRLDEVVRQVDDLPLLSSAERRGGARAASASAAASVASVASGAAGPAVWSGKLAANWHAMLDHLWQETRSLVRVTRIDNPEAMLVAPEQTYFLRENLKLRLLNARLSLLSRQFDTAQLDLRDAQTALERYFDRSNKRVASAIDGVRQVAAQARQVTVPKPDATLAAIATATAGR